MATSFHEQTGQYIARLKPGVRPKLKEIAIRDERSINFLINKAVLKWLKEEEGWTPEAQQAEPK